MTAANGPRNTLATFDDECPNRFKAELGRRHDDDNQPAEEERPPGRFGFGWKTIRRDKGQLIYRAGMALWVVLLPTAGVPAISFFRWNRRRLAVRRSNNLLK
jgi:hypothetical protein